MEIDDTSLLRSLQEKQTAQTEQLKALKRDAAANKEPIAAILAELQALKAQIKDVQARIKAAQGDKPKEDQAAKAKAQAAAKEERARKAKELQDKNAHNKFFKEISSVDTTDVSQTVLEAPFAGSRFHPGKKVLPIPGQRNILITSALPYVNNVPHLGNLIGCVLSADVYARFARLRGYNTLFICGTDEYGTATETKALAEGMTPIEVCNKYSVIHDQIYKWFGISFDHFGRTTCPEQKVIAQDIFLKLHKANQLVEQTVPQLLCPSCSRFLADRYVEGTCPKCAYEDARGDQCDKCGALLNAVDLINPRCKLDGATPSQVSSQHLFLNLPNLSDKVSNWVDEASTKGKWSENGISITQSWIKAGLAPRCITRDLKWGTPVPLEEMKDKVLYVWFDAPIGYLSATAEYTDQWEKWWKDPDNVQLYQFMGKDNVPFHTVIFPASLIGTGESWTLLHHLSTTEYLNYEGKDRLKVKFSKSRGVGVFGDNVQKVGINQEVWRYYLLMNRPESSDTLFNWDDFGDKNNKELLANLGNFFNRCLKFTETRFSNTVPDQASPLTEVDNTLIDAINKHVTEYIAALEGVSIKEALRICVIDIATLGNAYLQDNKPWELIPQEKKPGKRNFPTKKAGEAEEKETEAAPSSESTRDPEADRARCATVINVASNLAYLLAVLLEPFMPSFTEKILHQMQLPHRQIPEKLTFDLVPARHVLGQSAPIFRELAVSEVDTLRASFG